MDRQRLFLPLLVLVIALSFFSSVSIPITQAASTLILRSNAVGTYSQFVEVPNAGFLFGDQFESNDLSLWTGTAVGGTGPSSIAVQSVTKHHGSYAVKSILTTDEDYAVARKNLGSTYDTVYMGSFVQFSATPLSGDYLEIHPSIRNGVDYSELAFCMLYNDAGTLKWDLAYQTDAVPLNHALSATPTISLNTWYWIVIYFKGATSTGSVALYIDGNLVTSVSSLTNDNSLADRFDIGAYIAGGNLAVSVYHDCTTVSTSDITAIPLRYNYVNDSSDNTALQITTSTTQKETENLAASGKTTETINSVTAYCRAKTSGSTSDKFVFLMRMGASETESAEIALTTSYAEYSVAINDPDSGAWSWADIDALELGSRASTLAATKVESFSDYWIVVTYMTPYTVAISAALTGAWSAAVKSTFNSALSKAFTSAFNVGALSAFNVALTKSLSFASSIGTVTAFRSALSQALTSGLSVGILTSFSASLSQALSSTFNVGTLSSFAVGLSQALTFICSVSLGAASFVSDLGLSLSLSTSTVALAGYVSMLTLSLSSALSSAVGWVSNVGLVQSVASSLSSAVGWTTQAVLSIDVASAFSVAAYDVVEFMADLSLNIGAAFNTIIHLYYIPDTYATKGFVLAAGVMGIFIIVPILALILARRR